MSPVTRFLGSWLVASLATDNPRDRKLVTLAGVLPDADALGLVVDGTKLLVGGGETSFESYQRYHHLLLHGWPGAIAIAAVLPVFARRSLRAALMCLLVFHLDLLCDLLGSRGPSPADLWPVCYGESLFRHPIWFWKGQWRLDGWQNTVIVLGTFGAALWVTVRRGFSFAEVLGQRTDRAFTGTLKKWADAFVRRLRELNP